MAVSPFFSLLAFINILFSVIFGTFSPASSSKLYRQGEKPGHNSPVYLGGMENGIGRPKRPEPKEDDLGFDPSQFALDQLDLTRNKLNDMNLNPRQPNKPR